MVLRLRDIDGDWRDVPATTDTISDYQTVRATTGEVAGSGEADVTVTFAKAFVDTDYTVSAVVVDDNAGEALRVRRVRSLAAASCVVNVVNNALGAQTGVVHVIAIHD